MTLTQRAPSLGCWVATKARRVAALKELHDTAQPNVVPEAVAGRIIAAAKFGERNPARLLAATLVRP
jgi:hypothetical protein